jgi:hypothetical protein
MAALRELFEGMEMDQRIHSRAYSRMDSRIKGGMKDDSSEIEDLISDGFANGCVYNWIRESSRFDCAFPVPYSSSYSDFQLAEPDLWTMPSQSFPALPDPFMEVTVHWSVPL